MLVYPQKDAVVVTHLKGGKGITACHAACQDVALGALKQLFLQRYQRQGGEQRLFLPEVAGDRLHVLGEHQLFHFIGAPLQFLKAVRRDGDEDVHVIEILVVCKPFLQEIAGADGAVKVIEVRVGVGGVLDLGAVDS